MDCSLPGSSVHGIFQARVLEWGAIAFSCNSSIMSVLSITFWPSLPTFKLIPDSKILSDMPTLVIHDSSVILLSLIYFHYYLTYIINHCDEISPAYTCLACFFFFHLDKFWLNLNFHLFIAWVSEWVSEVAQSCLTLPGSSTHGILQARILEWGAISFSRGSSRLRDRTQVSRIAGRCFTV